MGDQSFDRYLQSVAMFAFVIEVFCQSLDSRLMGGCLLGRVSHMRLSYERVSYGG
jgi:hypothetical protein